MKEKSTQREDKATKDIRQDKSAKQEVTREHSDLSKKWRYVHNHPKDLIIGDPSQGVRTRVSFKDTFDYLAFIS